MPQCAKGIPLGQVRDFKNWNSLQIFWKPDQVVAKVYVTDKSYD